jgi:hypothetical protein
MIRKDTLHPRPDHRTGAWHRIVSVLDEEIRKDATFDEGGAGVSWQSVNNDPG